MRAPITHTQLVSIRSLGGQKLLLNSVRLWFLKRVCVCVCACYGPGPGGPNGAHGSHGSVSPARLRPARRGPRQGSRRPNGIDAEFDRASVSPQTLSLLDSLDEALGSLESEDVHDRAVAAMQLSKLVEGVYGEDAAAVGNYVRESGALEMLLELVLAPLCTSATHAPRKQPTAPRAHEPSDAIHPQCSADA
eukprot:scaffold108278_cov60-Phaeocystis_antarctica.AAC.1